MLVYSNFLVTFKIDPMKFALFPTIWLFLDRQEPYYITGITDLLGKLYYWYHDDLKLTQPVITCSKLTIETPEKGVKKTGFLTFSVDEEKDQLHEVG